MSRLYSGSIKNLTKEHGIDFRNVSNEFTYVQYDSIDQYHKTLLGRKVSGRDDSSETRGDSSWYGTSSFEEAYDLMVKGDTDSLSLVNKYKEITDAMFKDSTINKVRAVNSVEGYQPIVPNALLGLPQSMINTVRNPKKVKIIDIFANASAAASINKDEIAFQGAMLLSTVEQLEKNGYRVNVYVGKISRVSRSASGHIVKIKDSMSPLNALKMSFYLVNPSFLRRVCFKIDEVEEQIQDLTHNGYGSADAYDDITNIIKCTFNKDLVVYDKECGVRSKNSDKENIDAINKLLGDRIGL